MRSVILVVALSVAGHVARAQGASVARACDVDEALRRICAIDDSLRSALVRADTATLARLYADDLLTINYRGVRSTKADLLRAIGSGTLRFDTLMVRQRVAEVNGDSAVVSGTMHQVARGAEGAHPLEVRYQRVYIRRAGAWRLLRTTINAADRPPNETPRSLDGQPAPAFPLALARAGVEGEVALRVGVDSLGRAIPAELRTMRSSYDMFARAARAAVLTWRFEQGLGVADVHFSFAIVVEKGCDAALSAAADPALAPQWYRYDRATATASVAVCSIPTRRSHAIP